MKKFGLSGFAIVSLLAMGAGIANASPIPFAAGTITTTELGTAAKHDNWSAGTHTSVTLHPNTTSVSASGSLTAANGHTWTEPASLGLTTGVVSDTFKFDNNNLIFVLTDISSVTVDKFSVVVIGSGLFEGLGHSNTPGDFTYSASDSTGHFGRNSSAASETFSVIVPTPEPSSLVLLGSGLLGAAFLLFRRKRSATN